MENVYCPENFYSTEPLDLLKYFKEYQTESNVKKYEADDVFEIRQQILKEDFNLDLSLNDIKELEDLCTIDKLKLSNENPELPIKEVPKNHQISTYQALTSEAKKLETVKCKEVFNLLKNDMNQDLRVLGLVLNNQKDDVDSDKDLQPGSTFIYNVVVHIPFNTLLGNRLTPESIRVQYEIEVLGTTSLKKFVDAIKCVSDSLIISEVQNTSFVDLSGMLNAKEKYPSRCLFIENVFYNDMSHPKSIDYSTVVKKWAAENKIGEFQTQSMEGVTFDSLKPRLGFGYVYIHQGNCEHIICFSDVRLIQASDCLISSKYPRIVFLKRPSSFLCYICSENHASWMVSNSDRLPVKKAFFCTRCCDSFMFFDGKKIGNFQLYPYNYGVVPSQTVTSEFDEPDLSHTAENVS